MSRTTQRLIALGLLVLATMLNGIVVAAPGSLGLTPVAVNWVLILNLGIAVALNGLPTIWQAEPDPPLPPRG